MLLRVLRPRGSSPRFLPCKAGDDFGLSPVIPADLDRAPGESSSRRGCPHSIVLRGIRQTQPCGPAVPAMRNRRGPETAGSRGGCGSGPRRTCREAACRRVFATCTSTSMVRESGSSELTVRATLPMKLAAGKFGHRHVSGHADADAGRVGLRHVLQNTDSGDLRHPVHLIAEALARLPWSARCPGRRRWQRSATRRRYCAR